MGYQGRVIGTPPTPSGTIPRRAMDLLPAAARAIVDDGTDFMLTQVKINTPVSDPPVVEGYENPLPGGDGVHMRDEIHRTEVHVEGDDYEAEVGSNKPYAPYVEEGTGLYGPEHAKYLIEPHNPGGWLAWPGRDGKMHFARLVWHPGSPGQHMFLIGGEVTDRSMRELSVRGDTILVEGMR